MRMDINYKHVNLGLCIIIDLMVIFWMAIVSENFAYKDMEKEYECMLMNIEVFKFRRDTDIFRIRSQAWQ